MLPKIGSSLEVFLLFFGTKKQAQKKMVPAQKKILWQEPMGRTPYAKGHLLSASDNFDKELMMDHDLDKLPKFLRQVITSSPEFLKKSSTYNNLVAMAVTVVCNYNQTQGFSRRGQGLQSIFMNGHVHHYMRIASSNLQNCSISYFIFDDIASLAGSADT
jgi:hypothetical protein